jgi:poly(A) polymerase/tRNA nucleotidyltransferase (CCA-adding enzyme)
VPGLARRLRLSGAERDRLERLTALSAVGLPVSDKYPGPLRGWLADRSREEALAELWLAEAADGQERALLRARVAAMEVPVFPIQGRDLLALGLAPGPVVGRLLQEVRGWWIAGGAEAGREACLAEAKRRMEGVGAAYGPAAPTDPDAG